jgi:hypothetical protein
MAALEQFFLAVTADDFADGFRAGGDGVLVVLGWLVGVDAAAGFEAHPAPAASPAESFVVTHG